MATWDLLKQLDIGNGEVLRVAAGKIDGAEGAAVGGQRHAADHLHTLFTEEADDFRMKAVDFRAAGDEDLAAGDGPPGRRTFLGNGEFGLEWANRNGKVEGVNFEQGGVLVEKSEAGVVVLNNGLE
jgi:hypothetical protein